MIKLYHTLTGLGEPILDRALLKRLERGKEDESRIDERKGVPSLDRPQGVLFWLHAASVGEVQSALILINRLLNDRPDLHILVTTGTVSSARKLQSDLPDRAFHQYYPLDHPQWCNSFLAHWKPDLVLWMESELWPNMLNAIKSRSIPAALINARMSKCSYKAWRIFSNTARELLSCFNLILCQGEEEANYYNKLGARNVETSGNIKYSASPLPFNQSALQDLRDAIKMRPCWVYASTHKGEEELALRVHRAVSEQVDDLLTIIVPRHPERRDDIARSLDIVAPEIRFRGNDQALPDEKTQVYIADSFGELGLFYRLCSIAVIGRSFSDDGGGGHNPIEAARLGCFVLHGSKVQNLQDIYDEMDAHQAAIILENEQDFISKLTQLLDDGDLLKSKQDIALNYSCEKLNIIDNVLEMLSPLINSTYRADVDRG